MKKILLLIICVLIASLLKAQEKKDSVSSVFYMLNGTVSASYIDQHNWEDNSKGAISLLASVDARHRLQRASGWMHNHSMRTEISYLKYNDSTWIKNSDYVRMAFQWIEPGKKLNHSYSILFATQWLNSWQQELTESGYRKNWMGGFFNPAILDLAYGINQSIWKNSNVNIAFANVRISTQPRINNESDSEKDKSVFLTPHSYIKTMYGFSAQLDVMESLYKDVLLIENNSQLFFNALSRSTIHFDFNNRIAVRFMKFLQLRFDTHLIYNPFYNCKLQYRQEVLLGMFFEHRRNAK